jgi:hypothetical protein
MKRDDAKISTLSIVDRVTVSLAADISVEMHQQREMIERNDKPLFLTGDAVLSDWSMFVTLPAISISIFSECFPCILNLLQLQLKTVDRGKEKYDLKLKGSCKDTLHFDFILAL